MTLNELVSGNPYIELIDKSISELEELKSVIVKSSDNIDDYSNMNDIINNITKRLDQLRDTINIQ